MGFKNLISLDQPIPPEVFRFAIDQAYNQIVITDCEGSIVYANQGLERVTSYGTEEVIGQTPRIWGGQMTKEFYEQLWKTIKTDKKVFCGEVRNKRKNQSLYYAILTITPIVDYTKEICGFIAIEEEVTRYKSIK